MDLNALKNSITNQNVTINNIVQLKNKKTGEPSPSYLIYAPKSTNMKDIKNISAINDVHAKWEHFAKRNQVT